MRRFAKERGIGFEDVVFHIERGDLLDIRNTRTPAVTSASASSSSGFLATYTTQLSKHAKAQHLPLGRALANTRAPPTGRRGVSTADRCPPAGGRRRHRACTERVGRQSFTIYEPACVQCLVSSAAATYRRSSVLDEPAASSNSRATALSRD